MVITLLLDPQWRGIGQTMARVFLGPPLLLLVVWIVRRARRLLRSEFVEDRKAGWMLLVLTAVITAGFLLATQSP